MTCLSSQQRVFQLRQSYVEISNYVRKYSQTTNVQLNTSSQAYPRKRPRPHVTSQKERISLHLTSQKHVTSWCSSFRTANSLSSNDRYHAVRCFTTNSNGTVESDTIATFQHGGEQTQTLLRTLLIFAGIHSELSSDRSWLDLEQYDVSNSISLDENPTSIQIYGYVTGHRIGKKFDFLTVVDPHLRKAIQVVCPKNVLTTKDVVQSSGRITDDGSNSAIRAHTPILVIGTVSKSQNLPRGMREGSNVFQTTDQCVGEVSRIGHIELQATSIKKLNTFPPQLIAKHDTQFPPEKRYLQLRTDNGLRDSIRLRSRIKAACTNFLLNEGFDDIETPLLFKSTPEGAREFVVPTRRKGFAYALPQSPQQYKQVLMASGIPRYFQFARCFRDEDLRADRQPEFTQLDLEMSFAGRETIMSVIERLILDVVWPAAGRSQRLPPNLEITTLNKSGLDSVRKATRIPVYTYQEVMSSYGSDKPDPRLGGMVVRVEKWVSASFKQMLTDLEDPIIEMVCITTKHQDPTQSRMLMSSFMDLPGSASYLKGSHGMAGISIYDPRKPLSGLAAFGHEAANQVEEIFKPEEGDILVAQARPNLPFSGGSTVLGSMRRDLLQFGTEQGLFELPLHDSLFWVVDFPLFSPVEENSPGQGGGAGICSTHHPFTAPRNGQDLSKLFTDPLSIVGDHYDLVINGTEVGGGSRRIHHPEMQELIFKNVLQMKPERIEDFRHLLDALAAGCPPHAGLALGFDRLMALLLEKLSVRDVIAFPKWGDGEDKFVGSPSQLTSNQLKTYHLEVVDTAPLDKDPRISIKA